MRVATSSAELRAAASLRAAAFADDKSTTSTFTLQVRPQSSFSTFCCAPKHWQHCWLRKAVIALQSFRRMKADEEWDILERKVAGKETGWEVASLVKHFYCHQHRLDDQFVYPTCPCSTCTQCQGLMPAEHQSEVSGGLHG